VWVDAYVSSNSISASATRRRDAHPLVQVGVLASPGHCNRLRRPSIQFHCPSGRLRPPKTCPVVRRDRYEYLDQMLTDQVVPMTVVAFEPTDLLLAAQDPLASR